VGDGTIMNAARSTHGGGDGLREVSQTLAGLVLRRWMEPAGWGVLVTCIGTQRYLDSDPCDGSVRTTVVTLHAV
jgi:hypothetical protein